MFAESLVDTRSSEARRPPRRPPSGPATSSEDPSQPDTVVESLALAGLEPRLVRIHARVEPGSRGLVFLGLSDSRMREARVRVQAALRTLGLDLPALHITIRFEANGPDPHELLASTASDAAIAIAVHAAAHRIDVARLRGTPIVSELSFDGSLRAVRGVLPMARGAAALGVARLIVPARNGPDAALATGARVEVAVADHLSELVRHLTDGTPLQVVSKASSKPAVDAYDLSEIRGMRAARRTLEIAAAGGHGLLVTGPPMSGKLALARRLPGILPTMSEEEALDTTVIHSVAGLHEPGSGLCASRPFRAPHSTVSTVGLLGGGDPIHPGEVTLAHHGVLCLDDVPSFRASVLESLAAVLRDGQVTVSRAGLRTSFPANPILVCATHLCPCGLTGTGTGLCTCSPARRALYRVCLDRQFFRRLDLRTEVHVETVDELRSADPSESSAIVRERVTRARAFQTARARTLGIATTNGALTPNDLARLVPQDASASGALTDAIERLDLSEAAACRVLRVARTLADLAENEAVTAAHVHESLTLTVPSTRDDPAAACPAAA